MAGGYICRRYDFTGTFADDHTACLTVLQGIVTAIINTGKWELDVSLNASLTNYTSASGDYTGTTLPGTAMPCYMYFLTSTVGTEKLCVGYRYGFALSYGSGSTASRYTDENYRNAITAENTAGKSAVSWGVFASIIPAGSSSTFSTTAPYRPSDSTPFVFTALKYSFNYGTSSLVECRSMAYIAKSGTTYTYSYIPVTDGHSLFILTNTTNNSIGRGSDYYGGFICGKLIGTPYTQSDNNLYGTLMLSTSGNNFVSGSYYLNETYIDSYGISNNPSTYFTNSYYYESAAYWQQSVASADGTKWLGGQYLNAGTSSSDYIYGPRISAETYLLNSNVSNNNQWVPIVLYGYATIGTLTEYGVTNDTCIKGWVDPDLARIVPLGSFTRGQLFNNGSLVYIGAGLAIGWDASNTISIF